MTDSAGWIMRAAVVFYGLMFAAGAALRFLAYGEILPPLVWPRRAPFAEPAIFMLALGVHCALLRWGVSLSRSIAGLFEEIAEVFEGVPVRSCVVLALISGVAEETLFRGALQPLVGAPLATLLFAAVHFPATKRLRPWPLYALFMGAAFAALAELAGDIASPVLLHIAINAISLVTLARRSGAAPRGA